jgi:DNA-binding SARP family transcriptional activator/ABC-type branched-subunit amino acid transport system substrate-binding protein
VCLPGVPTHLRGPAFFSPRSKAVTAVAADDVVVGHVAADNGKSGLAVGKRPASVRQGAKVGVRISLTGRVSIEANGSRLDERSFPGRQGRLVFAYLLAEEGRAVPRDELAEVLWGDAPPATWEKALSVLVSKLRALLEECGVDGQAALRSAFGCYQLRLPAGAWIDVAAAREAVNAAAAALDVGDIATARAGAGEAVALARRSFLPGEDGAWVEEKRRELSELLVQGLECLADACLTAGDAREAVRHAEELTALEPYRESGYRRLMEAHAVAGDSAEALRVYERCRRLLADELGAYPSPETESIYRDLLRAPVKGIAEPIRGVEVRGKVELPPAPPPPPAPKPRRARRRRVLLVSAGLLLAAGLALAALELSEGGDANPSMLRTIASDRCSPLQYEGAGSPERLIVADLPLQPGVLATTSPMVDAMTLALERRDYKAGPYHVGLQVCDDAVPGSVAFDPETCVANAHNYVENPSVIGVVGPFSSNCAMLEIPILNRAPGGPVAIVSPSNTYVGLTRPTPASSSDEPGVYYPTGQRNYARVIPPDDVQAAADAIVARRLGVKRVYALEGGYPQNVAIVDDFIRTARRLGIAVAGRGSLDAGESSYAPLAAEIARTGADGVFLGTASDPDSVRLLRDLRVRLGPTVQFIATDGFDPTTAVLAGAAGEGMTTSQPGPSNDHLSGEGKQFVASFSKRFGAEPTRFAVSAAQAIDVLLDAIARSDGTRASVTRNLFTTRVPSGILGSFWITPTGDTTLNAVAIYRIIDGEVTTYATVVVPDALVAPD